MSVQSPPESHPFRRRRRAALAILLTAVPSTTGAACVAYDHDPANVRSIAADVELRTGGSFTFGEALLLSLRQHPELRALAARVRAADAARTVPLVVTGELRGRNDAVGVMLDPVALLGLGARGAAGSQADARLVAAVEELAVARWRVAAELAELYRVEAVLVELEPPAIADDAEAFRSAGLASPTAAARLQAAARSADAQRAEIARERDDVRSRMRHLLGLPPGAQIELVNIGDAGSAAAAGWFDAPAGTDTELFARPDLALAAANFEVADADFWRAVTDQYPTVLVGPNLSFAGDPTHLMGMVQLPVWTDGLALAARERREAARADFEDALLEARSDAQRADHELAATTAGLAATEAMLAASRAAFAVAEAALAVEVDAFGAYAASAAELVRDFGEHRRAQLAHVRAAVRRDSAYGWPAPLRTVREPVREPDLQEGSR